MSYVCKFSHYSFRIFKDEGLYPWRVECFETSTKETIFSSACKTIENAMKIFSQIQAEI